MASSPSEFLTFYRRLSTSTSLRTATRSAAIRSFGTTSRFQYASENSHSGDIGADKRHVLEQGKDKEPNIHAYESNKGLENHEAGTGGNATSRKDTTSAKAQAKNEHPEAPVVIGMEDERGSKGH